MHFLKIMVLRYKLFFNINEVFMFSERIAVKCVCCESTKIRSSPAVLMPFVAHRALGWEPVIIDASWGLKTLKNGHAYTVCKSLFCRECELLFLDIRFSESEMMSLYNDYRGLDYVTLRDYYEPGYAARNNFLNNGNDYISKVEDFLRPYISSSLRILDWGGDTGINTPFKDIAIDLDIYDISGKSVCSEGDFVSLNEALLKSYSLIICSNVLEHVPYPKESLRQIRGIMNDDAILYIEVPYEELMLDENAVLPEDKKHWHEHINFFSEKSLKILIKNAGMEILNIKKLSAKTGGNFSNIFQIACKIE